MLLALVCAGFVYAALRADFVSDDAFIAFRYARNLVRGDGLVWNPGERVEGYSDFLWVILLAALHELGADLLVAGRMQSLASGVATVVLTALLARRVLPGEPQLALAAAALVALNPCVAAWGAAGLETPLASALALAMVLPLVASTPTRRSFLVASGFGLALAATRPEGVALFAAVALAAALAPARDLRERVTRLAPGLGLFALGAAAYVAWRWSYFGDLLPNTYYAKSGFGASRATLGLHYLAAFCASPYVWATAPFALLGAVELWRRREPAPLALFACALAVVVALGGDGLPMYRFLVPVIPLAAVLAAVGAASAASRLPRAELREALSIAALAPALVLSFTPARDLYYDAMVAQRDFELPRWRAAGEALARVLPREALVAAVPIGALGYYSDVRVLDMVGLTDRAIAHAPVETGAGWAGHEKHDGRYVLARRPDAILLGNIFVVKAPNVALEQFPTFTNPFIAAREGDVLAQPEFARDYAQATLPLENGWTLHFFVRKDSSLVHRRQ